MNQSLMSIIKIYYLIKSLKITIWWEGTFFFIFYVVNLDLDKFGPHPGGSYGVYPSMWELKVGSGPI